MASAKDLCKITEGELRRLTEDEKKGYKTKYEYVLLSECVYEYQTKKIVVPPGFLTDGSSGGPDYGSAWIFHDYLYATHAYTSVDNSVIDSSEPLSNAVTSNLTCSRQDADAIFVQVLRHQRMFAYARIASVLSSLNFLWLFSRAWERSGERGPEFLNIPQRIGEDVIDIIDTNLEEKIE